MKLIEFTSKGIYCLPGKFYIDPWLPVDTALISHAHADHARCGMKQYVCHPHTAVIMRKRIAEDINVLTMEYGEQQEINGVKVSFHPAGHVIGSSQIRLELDGHVAVVSGDYKRQHDGISMPFEVVPCDEFVTESTFGLPIYQWQSEDEMCRKIVDWAKENREKGKTSVFIGYALGKAQRLMKMLEDSGNLFVHGVIGRLNEAVEQAGVALPKYEVVNFKENIRHLKGEIVILPPALLDSNVIRKIPDSKIAICSGWMHVRGARRWRSADAGFSISDHADWNALLQTVKETEAKKVYVTHGFADTFSKYLNEKGIKASPVNTYFGEEDEEITE